MNKQPNKIYTAWIDDRNKFLVIAPDIEQAKVEVANIAVMLFLEYGIVCKVVKIEEYKI